MTKTSRDALEKRAAGLQAILEKNPDDATAWYGLGRARAELAELTNAIVAFRRALTARPGYAAADRELGKVLLESGEAAAARQAFEEGIANAEVSGDLQTAREMQTFLRRARRMLGEEDESRVATAAAPSAERPETPVSPEARQAARELYKRGFTQYADGQLDDAIATYEQALDSDPSLAIAWNALSIALGARDAPGDLDAAVEAANQLIELEPEDALSHTNLSRLLMQQGRIPEAEEARALAMRMQMRSSKG